MKCFLFSFIWLLYDTIFNQIYYAVQNLLQNEISDLWFWPLTLGSKSQNFVYLYSFTWLLTYYVVQILAQKLTVQDLSQNEIFYLWFDLWPWGQDHKVLFIYLALYVYCIVQFLAKSIKPFSIYHKMKYLTFDFEFWPWGQGHEKKFLLLCLSASMVQIWTKSIQSSPRKLKFSSPKEQQQQLQSFDSIYIHQHLR